MTVGHGNTSPARKGSRATTDGAPATCGFGRSCAPLVTGRRRAGSGSARRAQACAPATVDSTRVRVEWSAQSRATTLSAGGPRPARRQAHQHGRDGETGARRRACRGSRWRSWTPRAGPSSPPSPPAAPAGRGPPAVPPRRAGPPTSGRSGPPPGPWSRRGRRRRRRARTGVGGPARSAAATSATRAPATQTSATTRRRAASSVRGGPGNVSRHRAPGPSRLKALTPKSSPAPDATRPGSSATMDQSRPDGGGGRAGDDAERDDAAAQRGGAPYPGVVDPQVGPKRCRWRPGGGATAATRRAPAPERAAAAAAPRAGRPPTQPAAVTPSERGEVREPGTDSRRRCRPRPSLATTPRVGASSRASVTRPETATAAAAESGGGDQRSDRPHAAGRRPGELDQPAGALGDDGAAHDPGERQQQGRPDSGAGDRWPTRSGRAASRPVPTMRG